MLLRENSTGSNSYHTLLFLFLVSMCSLARVVRPFIIADTTPFQRVLQDHCGAVRCWCQASEYGGTSQEEGKRDGYNSEAKDGDNVRILPSQRAEDQQHLWKFLGIAAHETDLKVLRSNPDLARYVGGYDPTNGDIGYLAVAQSHTGALLVVGAAWLRFWSSAEKNNRGFGYVRADIPELAIGIDPEFQRRGIGSQLLGAVLTEASAQQIPAVSLSCLATNTAALKLYRQCGFSKLDDTDVTNPEGIASFTMIKWLKLLTQTTTNRWQD